MYKNIPVAIVASMGSKTRVIGHKNNLLWHVPADMRRFKELTLHKPVILGRKTFESIIDILGKPLPNRLSIVVTRDQKYKHDGITVVHSLEEAFAQAAQEKPSEIHIGGGSELYRQALPFVDNLHITIFHDDLPGDTFFPEFESDFTEVNRSQIQLHKNLQFEWVDFKRTVS